jgi:2-polyprenyl-3-methyl-5-hydroxy-6-metoxy-1,4-benzoquinol methylase
MLNRQYRSKFYENYTRVQMPKWNEPSTKSDTVWIKAALGRLRGWLPADLKAKCLDLGCGSGLVLETLRHAGYSDLRGVDIGGQAVDIAREKGFQVAQADLCDFLRESNGSFDLITAFDVVEHFGKDEIIEVFTLVRDCLKPGGRFILQTPNASSPLAASIRYGDLTHEWIFNADSLIPILCLVGFNDVRIREITPYVHGVFSAMRWAVWNLIRTGCALWYVAETGSARDGVYTRNMIAVAFRPLELQSQSQTALTEA